MVEEFALQPIEVVLAVEIGDAHAVACIEWMAGPDAYHETLVVEAARMKALVDVIGLTVDRDIELSLGEALLQLQVRAILDDQPNLRMTVAEGLQERHEATRADGAHHAELQVDVLELGEAPGPLLRRVGLDQDLGKMRAHHLAEPREVRIVALAAKKGTAQLVLEALDGARQRRLRYVAGLRRPREVQRLADGQKVADLMHLHG